MEQAVQLAVAAAKTGLSGASSDERDLFRDQLLQGTLRVDRAISGTLVCFGVTCVTRFGLLSKSVCLRCQLCFWSNAQISSHNFLLIMLGCSAGLEVTILGSNDFYSFRKQVGQASKQLSVSHQGVMIFPVYGRFSSFFTV